MKPLAKVTFIALAASVAGRAIQAPALSTAVNTSSILPAALHLRELKPDNTTSQASTVFAAGGPGPEVRQLTPEQKDAAWCKAKSRGSQLTKAMMMNDQEAATLLQWPYTQSPWDGDLKSELRKWGYKEINNEMNKAEMDLDGQCNFDKTHELGDAFRAINVNPLPAGKGGLNHCFYVEHKNGPTIIPDQHGRIPDREENQYYMADGTRYRVTQGFSKVGINADDGLVYFIHRHSPELAAKEYWNRDPGADELPALRSSSDIVWGMWNRVAQGSRKLNYFLSVSVVNQQSEAIMERAIQQSNMAAVPPWPGKDFEFAIKGNDPSDAQLAEMEAALALLGSPNGISAGYFLIQHRRQLGWKYIWKVKIWTAGKEEWAAPNILFYVSDRAPIAGPQAFDDQLNRLHTAQKRKRDLHKAVKRGTVLYESNGGKNIIREHRIVAKL